MRRRFVLACVLPLLCGAAAFSQTTKPSSKLASGDRWAILVGVDKYQHVRPDLEYCGADVRALGDRFVKAGFGKNRVCVLDEEANATLHPTKANIEKQLRLTLDSAGPGSFVCVSFSGHGVRLAKRSYLCPFDAKMDPSDLISVDSVYDQLLKCRAGFKLFLIDACQDERNRPKEVVSTRSEAEIQSFELGKEFPTDPTGGGIYAYDELFAGAAIGGGTGAWPRSIYVLPFEGTRRRS